MKDKYPKAWADFEDWFSTIWLKKYYTAIGIEGFKFMPFEMQLGIYLKYIHGLNNPDIYIEELNLICVAENDFKLARQAIEQAFKEREEQL